MSARNDQIDANALFELLNMLRLYRFDRIGKRAIKSMIDPISTRNTDWQHLWPIRQWYINGCQFLKFQYHVCSLTACGNSFCGFTHSQSLNRLGENLWKWRGVSDIFFWEGRMASLLWQHFYKRTEGQDLFLLNSEQEHAPLCLVVSEIIHLFVCSVVFTARVLISIWKPLIIVWSHYTI